MLVWQLMAWRIGWEVDAVAWLGALTIAAATHILLIAYAPRFAFALAEQAPLVMGIGFFIGL